MELNANPNNRSQTSFSAIESACITTNRGTCQEIIQILIENGAEVDAKSGDFTALFLFLNRVMYYDEDTSLKIIKLLLDAGASPYDDFGNSILFPLVIENQHELLSRIIEWEIVDINHNNQEGESALVLAYLYESNECIELLIANGAQ